MTVRNHLAPSDRFVDRHIGPRPTDITAMLDAVGASSLDSLADEAIPGSIRFRRMLDVGAGLTEPDALAALRAIADENIVIRTLIGMGYHGTITPTVILRNILENPGWYTQYTPYQAEIAQGRLEALVNFQTVIAELTGLPLANASLLDEGTAAAEAMAMLWAVDRKARAGFFVAEDCHPQTIAVIQTRAEALGIEVFVGPATLDALGDHAVFGALVQYPTTDGRIEDYRAFADAVHARKGHVVAAADLLALTLITPPGEWGADVAVGSSQRFGVPMGFGGPHAAFLATREEFTRQVPGRIIGVSVDATGKPAYRLAVQTREQHIRRDKATSNICTAQVLLAIIAGAYAVYHGAHGLVAIARRVHALTSILAQGLRAAGHELGSSGFFDTLKIHASESETRTLAERCLSAGFNVRTYPGGGVGLSLDECSTLAEITAILRVFGYDGDVDALVDGATEAVPAFAQRTSSFLQHTVFKRYRSEHELLRYLHRLESRDLSLTSSMIPLGSCTMKLNATSEMIPVTWREFSDIHPFAPREQWRGYARLLERLEGWLAEITGFAATSLQPNAGSQGEYAGLMTIRAFHKANGQAQRDVCLIPVSAHGTNPASAVTAGMRVVAVKCDENGNIDLGDLRARADEHADRLGALMITYPSTHGVFEEEVRHACEIAHARGAQVYLDGANMNAQVGLCRPGDFGADVCHLNLHKTFCIPHGGGGPGMGPICVAAHLAPFLPNHPIVAVGGERALGPVSAAPFGSASILPISYAYISMMGGEGLKRATEVAILNANYMAARLSKHFNVLFRGPNGRVAHEFVLDLRPFKVSAGVEAEDVAKRLMDYGFHAPTMSWPVPGTLMIEPTESESREELDRFCEAMIQIRSEIDRIAGGEWPQGDNPLKNAPHTAAVIAADTWDRPYSRGLAAFPLSWVRESKFWPHVSRVDNAYGDRNLVCTCLPMSEYADS